MASATSVQLMQSSGGMATVESATQRPVNLLMSGPVAGLIGGIWAGRMAGLRERRHARHGRHLGRHRRRRGRAAADAAPARHEGRRLPGDGADGRHRHDRRRRRLDRLRRRRRRLPRRAAVGGRRPRPGVLRPRRRRSRPRPTPSSCSGACGPTAACSAARCCSTSSSPEAAMRRSPSRLGMTVEEAALGALQIQKFGMTQAIELNSVRRGYDPREFTLVAAGGAGPLFACEIALELEIPRVLVPPHPGITSATGLLATDLQHEYVATRAPLAQEPRPRAARCALRRARRRRPSPSSSGRRPRATGGSCAASPTAATPVRATRFASTSPPARSTTAWVAELAEAFHRAHEREYGHRFEAEIEIVNVRVVGDRPHPRPPVGRGRGRRRRSVAAPGRSSARSCFDVERQARRAPTPFYDRDAAARRATGSRARRSSSSTTRRRSSRPASSRRSTASATS